MSHEKSEISILLADVTGSTALYAQVGDAEAHSQINRCLGEIRRVIGREGGNFIHSKGDDVLCTFTNPNAALIAAHGILLINRRNRLSIHAGLHHGSVIRTDNDIFGDCVNVCARLASLANPGEVLVSQNMADNLSVQHHASLRVLDDIVFKGKDEAIRVYSMTLKATTMHTEIGDLQNLLSQLPANASDAEISIELKYGKRTLICTDSSSVTIGRSGTSDLVVDQPWVSRQHATISVIRNKAQLVDRSSGGTYITMGDNPELPVLRETVLLIGTGTISPTLQTANKKAELISFNVIVSS